MVSEDLEIEILLRLSLKSLMRCMSVSKRWASLIRREDFRKLYLTRSMRRPRVLFTFSRRSISHLVNEVIFHSVYQEEEPLLSSGQQQMRVSPFDDDYFRLFTNPTGGLICFRSENTIKVCNPCTRQVITSPEYQYNGEMFVGAYLGYDEATDVFKVLCTMSGKATKHQVFTVGSDSWRKVGCFHFHCPITRGICIGGVIYYGAYLYKKYMVISFNVTSEEFITFKLPAGVSLSWETDMVNYYGEIAVVDKMVDDNGEFRILVLNKISGEWREEHIVVSGWREADEDMTCLSFVGIIKTGELVFARNLLKEGSHTLFYYNKEKQSLTKFQIKGVVDNSFDFVRTFLNHVDRPYSLPI